MDTERLKELSSCQGCEHLYTLTGECRPFWFMSGIKTEDFECPKGVRQPQQEYAKE